MGFVAALPGAVAEYIKAWNETDVAGRTVQLNACWGDDAAFRDWMGAAALNHECAEVCAGFRA